MKRLWLPLSLVLAACGGEERPPFVLPGLNTPYAVFGTSVAGRPLNPGAVRFVDLQRGEALRPEQISGTAVDVVWAGLQPSDLPAGVSFETLRVVAAASENARPLPPLYTPHVLSSPSPPDEPAPLVPVEEDGLPRRTAEDRGERLRTMLSGVAIADPCRPPSVPWDVWIPRTPAEGVARARAMSDGSTALGLITTSTANLGVLPAGEREVRLLGVGVTDETVPPGSRGTVILGGDEVVHPSGLRVPALLGLNVGGGFGSFGFVWRWSAGTWREDSPNNLGDDAPLSVRGVQTMTIDGVENLCAFGTSLRPLRPAAIWCRPTGGAWSLLGDFDDRFGIASLRALDDGDLLATDVLGNGHRRSPNGWAPIFASRVNEGCDPLCVRIDLALPVATSAGDANVWLAGNEAQLLRVQVRGSEITASAPADFTPVLFGDERTDARTPANFTAITASPDGALWLATDRGVLLRLSPDGGIERVCQPDTEGLRTVGAMVAHDDGRLLLFGDAALIARSRWN